MNECQRKPKDYQYSHKPKASASHIRNMPPDPLNPKNDVQIKIILPTACTTQITSTTPDATIHLDRQPECRPKPTSSLQTTTNSAHPTP